MSQASTPSTDAPEGAGISATKRVAGYARYVFWLMFFINFLNYLDRWIFTGLSGIIQQDLRIDDFQIGLLTSAFLLVYTIVALPMGVLADRIARRTIVAVGVAIWSVATALTGLVGGFAALLGVRALLGIGEGSYYPAGTPMLAAWFAPSKRAKVLSRWGVGALLGAAIGFLLAAPFNHPDVWRSAFFFTGIPGLLVAFLMWRTREKKRHEEDPPAEHLAGRTLGTRLRAALSVPTVRIIIAVHALGFFALTGVTGFLTIYLTDTYGQVIPRRGTYGEIIGTTPGPFGDAGLGRGILPILAGGVVLLGGIFGNLAGGIIADRLGHRWSGARVLTGGLGFLLAAPCVIVAIGASFVLPRIAAYAALDAGGQVAVGVAVFTLFALLAAFFLNLYNGPMSAALLDVVPAADRGTAGGLELTSAHLLGDVWAAAAIGALADTLTRALGGNQIGLALLLTTPIALVGAGVVGIWGSRFYAPDVAKLGASADDLIGAHPAGA